MRSLLSLLAAGALFAGCAPKANESSPAPTPSSTPLQSATSPSAASSVEPVSPHGAPRGAEGVVSESGRTLSTPTLALDLPEGWRREQPSSSMRLIQAVVPGEAGPGELALFYFGPGQGGTVEGNFERWRGMIEAKTGATPEKGELDAAGFHVSWIDLAGTLLPSGMGSGPSTPQPGFRLIGAVVEGGSGPWFFKLTGPAATIAKEREAFFAVLRSCRKPG